MVENIRPTYLALYAGGVGAGGLGWWAGYLLEPARFL